MSVDPLDPDRHVWALAAAHCRCALQTATPR